MANKLTEKLWIPTTFGGWVVFAIANITAVSVAFSGIKELGFQVYDMMSGSSKEQRMEEAYQNQLWIKNKKCYKETSPSTFSTEEQEKLSILICKDSGDIYVELAPKNPSHPITHRWMEIPRHKPLSFLNGMNPLYAQGKTFLERDFLPGKDIVCKEVYVDHVTEIRKYSDGRCVKITKYFTGKIETTPVNCNQDCGN
jgi:hypothetical protein